MAPLLQPVPKEQATPEAQEIYEKLEAKLGRVLNVFGTLAHAPQVLEATLGFSKSTEDDLPPKLHELAYLHVSEINQCDY